MMINEVKASGKLIPVFFFVFHLLSGLIACKKRHDSGFHYVVLEKGLVKFSKAPSHPRNILWDFGDGSTSDVANPEHMYGKNGIYLVKLTEIYHHTPQSLNSAVSSKTVIIKNVNFFTCEVRDGGTYGCKGKHMLAENFGSDGISFSTLEAQSQIGRYYLKVNLKTIPDLFVPENISAGNLSFMFSDVSATSPFWADKLYPGSTGTLILQQNDAEAMKGTFEFSGVNMENEAVTITKGSFSISF